MRKRVRILAVLLVLIPALYAGIMALTGNFHTVIPGELYRSGQLPQGSLTEHVKHYGIKSVINLRGENTGTPWYDNEIAEAKQAHVKHIDIRLSTKRVLTKEQTQELIAAMRTAPKPLLIHCSGGANRTGLAAALYLAAIKKTDEETAEDQLSIIYGNFPRWLGSQSRMSESFEQMKPALGYAPAP